MRSKSENKVRLSDVVVNSAVLLTLSSIESSFVATCEVS